MISLTSVTVASKDAKEAGKEEAFGPGDVGSIPPGHDGWTVGNQPVVWLEISRQNI
jgi:hypothetical protein